MHPSCCLLSKQIDAVIATYKEWKVLNSLTTRANTAGFPNPRAVSDSMRIMMAVLIQESREDEEEDSEHGDGCVVNEQLEEDDGDDKNSQEDGDDDTVGVAQDERMSNVRQGNHVALPVRHFVLYDNITIHFSPLCTHI